MNTLFVAWQSPRTRGWFPVARLYYDGHLYHFLYTQGAQRAAQDGDFEPWPPFKALDEVYVSDQLFPLFANRLPSPSRPDYAQYIEYLGLPHDQDDPVVMLARSGGRRATDCVEIFPCPQPTTQGEYRIHFFAHGLRHLPPSSLARVNRLRQDEPLLVTLDFQNPYDRFALLLRTGGAPPDDPQIVGYCPSYLLQDAHEVLVRCPEAVAVRVERLNPPPAPLSHRLLCSLTACWPDGFRPCSQPDYEPIKTHAPA
jgi:hypothetical protein